MLYLLAVVAGVVLGVYLGDVVEPKVKAIYDAVKQALNPKQ